MENFGLILNTERLMRLPPNASQASKDGQLGLIAHECAHQWFGDLVTCESWEQVRTRVSLPTTSGRDLDTFLHPCSSG